MGAAMAASLAEAQAAQAAQLPLEERPAAEVQRVRARLRWGLGALVRCNRAAPAARHAGSGSRALAASRASPTHSCMQEFGSSQLLPALAAAAELDSLFQEGLRRPLIEFLKLEKVRGQGGALGSGRRGHSGTQRGRPLLTPPLARQPAAALPQVVGVQPALFQSIRPAGGGAAARRRRRRAGGGSGSRRRRPSSSRPGSSCSGRGDGGPSAARQAAAHHAASAECGAGGGAGCRAGPPAQRDASRHLRHALGQRGSRDASAVCR